MAKHHHNIAMCLKLKSFNTSKHNLEFMNRKFCSLPPVWLKIKCNRNKTEQNITEKISWWIKFQ